MEVFVEQSGSCNMDQWETGMWSCDLRANERPLKKMHPTAQTDRQTDKQTNRQTYMATLRPTQPRGPSWWKSYSEDPGPLCPPPLARSPLPFKSALSVNLAMLVMEIWNSLWFIKVLCLPAKGETGGFPINNVKIGTFLPEKAVTLVILKLTRDLMSLH